MRHANSSWHVHTQRRGIEIGIEERGARGALMEKTESQFANRHHDSGFLARAWSILLYFGTWLRMGSLAWTPATRHFEKLRRRSKRRQNNKWFGIISMLLCLHFVDAPVDASIWLFELFSCRTFSNVNRYFFTKPLILHFFFFSFCDFWNRFLECPGIQLHFLGSFRFVLNSF